MAARPRPAAASPSRDAGDQLRRLRGFVPALLNRGYDAVGVDPEAPEEPAYHRIEVGRLR